MLFIDPMTNMASVIDVNSFFFRDLAAHSFKIIHLHYEEQIDSVSQFLVVSFIVAKYTFLSIRY